MAANGPGTAPPSTISTHVLDTATGMPATGVHVILSKLDGDGRALRMTQALTDGDGRVKDLLERPLTAGVYRLEFNPGPDGFFARLAIDFRVDDVSRSYHVPLLLAPYGATTYRGS